MIAAELLSNALPPVKNTGTVRQALERMLDSKFAHFPVVEGKHFLGLVTEDDLLTIRDSDMQICDSKISLIQAFVEEDTHVYDVIRLFSQLKISVVPVVDKSKKYLGMVTPNAALDAAATFFSSNDPGGIIVLEMSNRDNSLSQMAQIVEADNAQILSSYVRAFPDSTRLEVTLKTNKTELSGLIAAFERYNYQVLGVYNNSLDNDDTDDRFNSLMNYLNV